MGKSMHFPYDDIDLFFPVLNGQLVKKILLEMVIRQQMKEEGYDQN